jgi:hypothetical protein
LDGFMYGKAIEIMEKGELRAWFAGVLGILKDVASDFENWKG